MFLKFQRIFSAALLPIVILSEIIFLSLLDFIKSFTDFNKISVVWYIKKLHIWRFPYFCPKRSGTWFTNVHPLHNLWGIPDSSLSDQTEELPITLLFTSQIFCVSVYFAVKESTEFLSTDKVIFMRQISPIKHTAFEYY